MQAPTIRLAAATDLTALATLFDAYRQFYEQAPDIALAKSFVADRLNQQDSVIFVAVNSMQQLIGFCQIYPSFCSVIAAKIGVLYDLFVDANARKTGAGRALMLAAHEYAATNGLQRLDLTTAKNNLKAQALYESLGWLRDEVFYSYSKNFT
ncbi:MAG: GNAT family N-acetyltransferase [Methylotenera sp.]|nr:GNAT family N-acetyltransferase [Methylotenera sp.]